MENLTVLLSNIIYLSENQTGQLHVLTALLALVSGLLVLRMRKGTALHRIFGLIYLFSMLSVNLSALLKYDLTGSFNLFHFAAILSLSTLLPAYAVILKARQTRQIAYLRLHAQLMCWSYFGLVMALVAEIVTRALPFMIHGEGGWQRFTVFLVLLMSVAGWVTHKRLRAYYRRWQPTVTKHHIKQG